MNNFPSKEEPMRWEDSVFGTILGPRRDGALIDVKPELEKAVLPNLQKWIDDNPDSVLDECDVGSLKLVISELSEHSQMRWEHCKELFSMAVIGPDITLSEQIATVQFIASVRNFISEHREDNG